MNTWLRQFAGGILRDTKAVLPERFPLDNAGKLYPAVATRDWNSIFRLSVVLKQEIDPVLLQRAADHVLPRFPSMDVKLYRGFFWFFLEKNTAPFLVHEDSGQYCTPFQNERDNGYLLRVVHAGRRISVEFFHGITDGGGALVFLKTMLAEYLRLCGHEIPFADGVLNPNEKASAAEMEDAYLRMHLPTEGHPRSSDKAYHLPGEPLPPPALNITMVTIPVANLLKIARTHGLTATEYLASAMVYTAALLQENENPKRPLPVRISIPVNMRQYFETPSLRNFSMFVNPGIQPSSGEHYPFERITKELHAFMAMALKPDYLYAGIASNVAAERHPIVRRVPLAIKNFVLRGAFRETGDRVVTTTLTNLGRITAPDELMARVERFELALGHPATSHRTNAALVSTGDEMCLTFTSNIKEDAFARETIAFLRMQGVCVTETKPEV